MNTVAMIWPVIFKLIGSDLRNMMIPFICNIFIAIVEDANPMRRVGE